MHAECRGFESHPRQLIFLRKSDCLGCAVLLCLVVCLTLLASSFLLISKYNMYMYMYVLHVCTCMYMYYVRVMCVSPHRENEPRPAGEGTFTSHATVPETAAAV